jgi:hypothetical protein
MKRFAYFLIMLSCFSAAQCTSGNPGTNCMAPLTVSPAAGNTVQSAIVLVDIGLPVPTPAVKSYILSIVSGVIQESDNGGAYHSLVGPPGQNGATGPMGPPGPMSKFTKLTCTSFTRVGSKMTASGCTEQ